MERGEIEISLRAFKTPASDESKYHLGFRAVQGRVAERDIPVPARR
jgi:hypothetical protein